MTDFAEEVTIESLLDRIAELEKDKNIILNQLADMENRAEQAEAALAKRIATCRDYAFAIHAERKRADEAEKEVERLRKENRDLMLDWQKRQDEYEAQLRLARKMRDAAQDELLDHSPEGHNVTNGQYIDAVTRAEQAEARIVKLDAAHAAQVDAIVQTRDHVEKKLAEAESENATLRDIVTAARRGSCDMSDGCPPNHGGLYPDAKFCEGCTLGPLLADLRKRAAE